MRDAARAEDDLQNEGFRGSYYDQPAPDAGHWVDAPGGVDTPPDWVSHTGEMIGLDDILSVIADFSPIGDLKGVVEAIAGVDATGADLSGWERVLAAVPILPGGASLGKADDVADGATDVVRGGDNVWRSADEYDEFDGLRVHDAPDEGTPRSPEPDDLGRGSRQADADTSAPPPSKALGDSLRAAGEEAPGPGHDAHHIVPTGLGGERLDPIREAVREATGPTGLNDARNGVFLPHDSAVENPGTRMTHEYIHANQAAYETEVIRRFTIDAGDGTREPLRGDELLDALDRFKQDLSDPDFRPPF
jgi:hypothetical protein